MRKRTADCRRSRRSSMFCSERRCGASWRFWLVMTLRRRERSLLRRFALAIAFSAGLFAADFDWNLPKGFPRPAVPSGNPMSAAKVELGRYLFYDKRMSVNGKESCGSCHRQELAFTDGRAHAEGTTGQAHPRSSMSLVNVAYAPSLTWANPALDSLEDQALIPMLGEEPIELGLEGPRIGISGNFASRPYLPASVPLGLPRNRRRLHARQRHQSDRGL